MRSLDEIVEDVRNGGAPDYQELRYAVCAMSALEVFDSMALRKLAEAEREGRKPMLVYSAVWQYDESFNRRKRAGSKPPKEYIGWNNDPDNPEFLKRRQTVKRIFDRVMKSEPQS